MRRAPSWLPLFVLVGGGYALGSQLAFSWFGADGLGASFFPAAGVTMAALLLVRPRRWPVVLAAAGVAELGVDLAHDIDLVPAAGYVGANLAQPLAGALLLRAIVRRIDLAQTSDLVAFLACAVVAAPALGGALGASTYVFLDGGDGWSRFAGEWWVGDGLGVLVAGGAILSFAAAAPYRLTRTRVGTGLVLGIAAIVATGAVFRLERFAFVYIPIVLLAVLAFRAGTRGVALTGAAMAFVAAEATADGSQYWETLDISPDTGLLYLQLALGVVVATSLALAAEITQREQTAIGLARAESERAAAQERANLAERERQARIHAESLARSAALLSHSSSVDEVAASVVGALVDWGARAAEISLPVKGRLSTRAATHPDHDSDALRAAMEAAGAEAAARAEPVIHADASLPGAPIMASVPVAEQGVVAAVFTAALPDRRWLDEDRRELLAALADQAAVALARAQLETEVRIAADDAALLARLGEVLERLTGFQDRAEALVRALAGGRASVAVVHALDEGGRLRVLARAQAPGAPELDESALTRGAAAAASASAPITEPAGAVETISAVLRARDRVLGVLSLADHADGSGRVTPVLAQRIATRAALALDNALLYEQEREVSHSLQMGLLGGELAGVPGTAIASAYRPATAALEVGGDWYDAFTLPSGKLALVVGDVVGHGLEAAVAMGQLRGAVRALAPMGGPHAVLEGLDLFVEQVPAAGMATVAYAELDVEGGRIAYACAGHPPPLVVPAAGEPRLLWEGRSTPLGSFCSDPREEAADELEPGDTIVLYTDGLVERRTEGVSAGLQALVETAGTAEGGRPAILVDRILDALLPSEDLDDDVCVLAVCRLPAAPRFVHAFPSVPTELRTMRRALGSWLDQLSIDTDRRYAVLLAASEAAANALEHAHGFDPAATIHVEASLADGSIRLQVRDEGTWREPRPNCDRGRGFAIIEASMDDVAVERGPAGTVVRMTLATRDRSAVT